MRRETKNGKVRVPGSTLYANPDKALGAKGRQPIGAKRRKAAPGYSQWKFRAVVEQMHGTDCWLAPHLGGKCGGGRVGMHVYPKNVLVSLFPEGALLVDDTCRPYDGRVEVPIGATVVTLEAILLDPENGLPGCDLHHERAGDTWSGVDFKLFPPCVRSFGDRYNLGWLDGVANRAVR